MDDLRWILLAVAVVIIAAVFFLSRNKKKEKTTLLRDAADEIPSFSANDSLEDEHNENRKNSEAGSDWVDSVGPVRVVSEADQQSFFDESDDWSDTQTDETEVVDVELDPEAESRTALEHNSEPEILSVVSLPEHSPEHSPEPQPEPQPEPINTQEPPLPEQPDTAVAPDDSGVSNSDTAEGADKNAQAEEDVIAVYVLASKEEPMIKGDKILSASYALNLQHGDMKIFHRIEEVSMEGVVKDEIQFSMANLLEPGWFDIENMNQLETAGLSFFMQVSLVKNPCAVLDEMLICAHKMSAMLGAKLCSAQRQLLDEAYATHLRNKVKRLVKAQKPL